MAKKLLSIPVRFESSPAEPIDLVAFLFSTAGELLQTTTVNAKGLADFKELDRQPSELQLFIVPLFDKIVLRARTIADLERYRPYKPILTWDRELNISILPIPEIHLKFWKLRVCRATGTVAKNFLIDGKVVKLPLCKARVHICEIDKIALLLPRIPDHIIVRIPDLIFNPPIPPVIIKWPPKPPIPIDPIGPVIFDKLRPDVFRPDVFRPDVFKPVRVAVSSEGVVNEAAAQPLQAAGNLPPITDEIKRALVSKNSELIRQTIFKNIELLHPYFCLAPWTWPYLYRSDEIKVVYTNDEGRFDTSIIYWAGGDVPDLYFWVEYLIDGQWVTVYRPSIPCHTYWNYICGTPVDIMVSDNRVRPGCGSVFVKDALWVRRIGASSILSVSQSSAGPNIQGVPFDRKGLFTYGGTGHRSPLGTTNSSNRAHFIIKFGSLLPNASARYFRWACKKVADEDMNPVSGTTKYLADDISKSYTTEWVDIFGDTHFRSHAQRLGPENVGSSNGLFYIPPATANGFLSISDATARWESTDTYTSSFDTRSLGGDGLYQFWLEIFDASGNQISKPDAFFQIPQAGDEGNSVNASAPWVGTNDGFNAFNMVVRVDNNGCQSAIYPVALTSPARTANACGFIKYTGANDKNISISFKAFHPNNFADFSFSVVRGNSGTGGVDTPASTGGMVIGPAGRYVRDSAGIYRPGIFPADLEFSPAELMGPCLAGGKAAFAQSLYVAALHTDGYRRLNELDASSLAAFALEA